MRNFYTELENSIEGTIGVVLPTYDLNEKIST